MFRSARKTVLISEPQSFRQSPFLPYVWAILKSFCERTPDLRHQFDWLEPLYRRDNPRSCLAGYRGRMPDVLGLSCYTWNWDLQCRIAALVKHAKPTCLVVAGGPHPDYKDPEFFGKHPYIDMVAVKDGEITFADILRKVLAGEADFGGIRGLYVPDGGAGAPRSTGPAEVPVEFPHSPYLDESAYYEKLRDRHGPGYFDAIWETNRGCPYSCNFCDWGSATMSRVRRFDIDRVASEVEWFARLGIKDLLLADANFGILPRDVEIAELLNIARARHGYPRFVHYSPAKNNPDRTVEIARKFAASGISPVYTFAVQHTDSGVLASADRANIAVEKQRDVAKAIAGDDIPTVVQLILGIPGDSYEKWKRCLTDLMEWGLHDNYQIFDYALLPNAPAADSRFASLWQLDTITRDLPKEGTGQRRMDDGDALTRVTIVTGSKSFSRNEWVKMKAYAAFVRALHNFGLSRLVAMYLHFGHGVPYREFYDGLIEDYFGETEPYSSLERHLGTFLADEGATGDLPFERFREHPLYLEPSRWVFVQICLQLDRYFDGIQAFLLPRFPGAMNLQSAIDYQRQVVVRPGDHGAASRCFRTDHDWIGYFEKARRVTTFEHLGEPAPAPGAVVTLAPLGDERRGPARDESARWLEWLEGTHEVRRTLSTCFQHVRLEAAR